MSFKKFIFYFFLVVIPTIGDIYAGPMCSKVSRSSADKVNALIQHWLQEAEDKYNAREYDSSALVLECYEDLYQGSDLSPGTFLHAKCLERIGEDLRAKGKNSDALEKYKSACDKFLRLINENLDDAEVFWRAARVKHQLVATRRSLDPNNNMMSRRSDQFLLSGQSQASLTMVEPCFSGEENNAYESWIDDDHECNTGIKWAEKALELLGQQFSMKKLAWFSPAEVIAGMRIAGDYEGFKDNIDDSVNAYIQHSKLYFLKSTLPKHHEEDVLKAFYGSIKVYLYFFWWCHKVDIKNLNNELLYLFELKVEAFEKYIRWLSRNKYITSQHCDDAFIAVLMIFYELHRLDLLASPDIYNGALNKVRGRVLKLWTEQVYQHSWDVSYSALYDAIVKFVLAETFDRIISYRVRECVVKIGLDSCVYTPLALKTINGDINEMENIVVFREILN